MAITRVQYDNNGTTSTSATSITATLTGVASGNVIVVLTANQIAATQSVSDDKSNSYTQVLTEPRTGDLAQAEIWYAVAGSSGDTVVTLTTSAGSRQAIIAIEYSGVASVSTVEASNSANGFSNSPNSGTVTASDNALIVGSIVTTTPTITPAGGLTSIVEETNWLRKLNAIEKILTSGGSNSISATLSGNGPWIATVASLIESAGGGGDATDGSYYYRMMQG